MRYYGTITGLGVGGGAAPAPAEKEKPDLRRLALLCVCGAVLVAGMIYIITKKKSGKRGRS
jgi:hypothetical protein